MKNAASACRKGHNTGANYVGKWDVLGETVVIFLNINNHFTRK